MPAMAIEPTAATVAGDEPDSAAKSMQASTAAIARPPRMCPTQALAKSIRRRATPLTGGLNRAAGENVGVYGINQGDLALNSGNYDLSYQGNNLTITKALLNVIADAKTKVYGDADPSLTYQVSGLKNGDSAGSILTGGLNRAAGENGPVTLLRRSPARLAISTLSRL